MVIGVIVILIGLLLPMVNRARRAAAQAACASNLHQWAVAVNMYAQANQLWLPRRGQGKMPTQLVTNYDDWFNELPPYLGQPMYRDLVTGGNLPTVGKNNIWNCPDLQGAANSFGNVFGYAMNMPCRFVRRCIPTGSRKSARPARWFL